MLEGVLDAARYIADVLGRPLASKVGQAGGWDAGDRRPDPRLDRPDEVPNVKARLAGAGTPDRTARILLEPTPDHVRAAAAQAEIHSQPIR